MDRQKARIILLLNFLQEQTDEQSPKSMKEILSYLEQEGIVAERKTIYSDVDTLRDCGYDIQLRRGRQGGYFLAQRHFTLPEVKMLLDMVQASPFLSQKTSWALIKKLENMMGRDAAKQLHRQVRVINWHRTPNEDIYETVDVINRCIVGRQKLSFAYFDWTIDGRQAFRKNGALYTVNPVALCVDKYYYLVAYDSASGTYRHYRVDRMYRPAVSPEQQDTLPRDFDLGAYVGRVFSMFHGEVQTVRLRLHRDILNQAIDRFGTDAFMRPDGPEHFVLTAEVDVSSTFYAWLFQFGGKAEILTPATAREAYIALCQESVEAYEKRD